MDNGTWRAITLSLLLNVLGTIPFSVATQECYRLADGKDYSGNVNTTNTGKSCQRWDQQFPHTHNRNDIMHFPESVLSHAENYCRNPDAAGRPWCYTIDPAMRWEYCDVPKCIDLAPEECKLESYGSAYVGRLQRTQSWRACQRWDTQSPQRHSFKNLDFPDGSKSAAENYCRNPDNKADGPWCFTMDAQVEWEYCEVHTCPTDCKRVFNGDDYKGNISVAISGQTCRQWDSISTALTNVDFVDGSISAANNFCRNPGGSKQDVWCYISESEFDYCAVPFCGLYWTDDLLPTTEGTMQAPTTPILSSTMTQQTTMTSIMTDATTPSTSTETTYIPDTTTEVTKMMPPTSTETTTIPPTTSEVTKMMPPTSTEGTTLPPTTSEVTKMMPPTSTEGTTLPATITEAATMPPTSTAAPTITALTTGATTVSFTFTGEVTIPATATETTTMSPNSTATTSSPLTSVVSLFPSDDLSHNNFSLSWHAWSLWSSCTASCQGGVQSRFMLCKDVSDSMCNQKITSNINNTYGRRFIFQKCNTQPCPIDGSWRQWSPWQPCSSTCSSGTQQRQRLCIGPFYNGNKCQGEKQQTELCSSEPCPYVRSKRTMNPTPLYTEADRSVPSQTIGSLGIIILAVTFSLILALDLLTLGRDISICRR